MTGATAVPRAVVGPAGHVRNEAAGDPTHRPGRADPLSRHRPLPRALLRLAAGRESPRGLRPTALGSRSHPHRARPGRAQQERQVQQPSCRSVSTVNTDFFCYECKVFNRGAYKRISTLICF